MNPFFSSPTKLKRSPQYLIGEFQGALLPENSELVTEDSTDEQPVNPRFKSLPGGVSNELFSLQSPDNSPLLATDRPSNLSKQLEEIDVEEDILFRRKCLTVSVKDYVFIEKLEENVLTSSLTCENGETRGRSKTLCLAN